MPAQRTNHPTRPILGTGQMMTGGADFWRSAPSHIRTREAHR